MKVLWCTGWSKTSFSGAQTQADLLITLLNQIPKIDVEPTNYPPLGIKSDDKYLLGEEMSDNPIYFPTHDLLDMVKEIEPDLVMFQCHSDLLLRDISRIQELGVKTVIRLGLNLTEILLSGLGHRSLDKMVKVITLPDHVVCASSYTEQRTRAFRPENTSVIPTCIDSSRFKPSTCRDSTVGTMGRIMPIKNHLMLLEAIKLANDKQYTELGIIGNGPLLPAYQGIVQILGLQNVVRFTGIMHDLQLLFDEISVFALPSWTENHPQAVLEAYACHVPCIVSDLGWGREFRCLHAFPDDPEQWAEFMIELLDNDTMREEVIKMQNKELKEKYEASVVVPQYIKLFQDLTE